MATYERGNVSLNISRRIWGSLIVVSVAFSVVLVRLWYLQIVHGDYFRDRSENNRTRILFTPSPRGLISDRNGDVLVGNRPSFSIDFVPEDSPDPQKTLQNLAELTGVPYEELVARLKDQRKRRRFEPKLLIKDVSRDVVAQVSARRFMLPGVLVNVVPARDYIYKDFAAHVLGYIREITVDQLKSPLYAGYRSGDVVGQYGIETRWEALLRGDRGTQAVLVNAFGTRIGELYFEPEIPGHNVTLTLDRRIQRAADHALDNKKGAIVVMDPRNGDILALASNPRFDPNIFTGEISKEVWTDLVAGKDNKLTNRAVQGVYPPGSVYKIFVALAGLSEEVTSARETVKCPGFLQFGKRQFRCHKHSGHGTVDLHNAIVQSCDVFFYILGQRLGVDRISEYAHKFGFGETTDLGLVEENPGLVPSTAWKAAYFKDPEQKRWYPGETLPVAIGQGAVTTTPLQIARALSAVINGGFLLKPRLIRAVTSVHGVRLEEHIDPEIVRKVSLDPGIVSEVRRAMVGVVNEPNGTGKRAQLPKELGITVAGKTGTSQVTGRDSGAAVSEDHAWFAGYAPAENPEVVVVAVIENGGSGGKVAAPVVADVLRAVFDKDESIGEQSEEGDSLRTTVPGDETSGD